MAKELLPQVTEMQADRLLAIMDIDKDLTRANLRWLRTAVDDPQWLHGAATVATRMSLPRMSA